MSAIVSNSAAAAAATPAEAAAAPVVASTPVAVPTSVAAPTPGAAGLTTTPAVVAPHADAMAEDSLASAADEQSRLAMLEQIKQRRAEDAATIAKLQSQLVAASAAAAAAAAAASAAEAEKTARDEAEFKTKVDMMYNLIDDCTAWTDADQKTLKASYADKVEMMRGLPPDKKRKFIESELSGLRACSASAMQQARQKYEMESALRSDQWASARERQLASTLVRRIVSGKNGDQFSTLPPPVPFGAPPVAVAAPTKPVDGGTPAPVAGDSGTVAASRHATTTPAVETPKVTQNTEGWAGVCFAASLAAQAGQRIITIPSFDDITRGGVVAVETGVVRKSRDAQGNLVQTAELELRQRFDTSKQFGLKEFDPEMHADAIKSLRTGVLHRHGRPVQSLPFDQSVYDRCANLAKQAEKEFNLTRRVQIANQPE